MFTAPNVAKSSFSEKPLQWGNTQIFASKSSCGTVYFCTTLYDVYIRGQLIAEFHKYVCFPRIMLPIYNEARFNPFHAKI
jgi:hypothetical protein